MINGRLYKKLKSQTPVAIYSNVDCFDRSKLLQNGDIFLCLNTFFKENTFGIIDNPRGWTRVIMQSGIWFLDSNHQCFFDIAEDA